MNVNVRNQSGQNGGKVLTSGQNSTGDFGAIQCITSTSFTTLDGNIDNATSIGTVPAGTTIFGRFKTITVSSGIVVAYNHA